MSGPWTEWPHRRRGFSEAAAADALLILASAVSAGTLDDPPASSVHHATVVRWPDGGMDVAVWRDGGGQVLGFEVTATGTTAEALTRAGRVLAAARWTVAGRWHRHGSGWRAAVTRTGADR